MKQAYSDNRPYDMHHEPALTDHTGLLIYAIRATSPEPRGEDSSRQPLNGRRDYLRSLGEVIHGYRQRREVRAVSARMRDGELELGEIRAWAARAALGSGFGGSEAANDTNYFGAA